MKAVHLVTEEQTDIRAYLVLLGWWDFLAPRGKKADLENLDLMVSRV